LTEKICRNLVIRFSGLLTGRGALRNLGICMVLFLLACFASAQNTASISGTVKDAAGAVIPGAKVVLINESSKGTRSERSNGDGFFYFAAVQPGATYSIQVGYKGFEDWDVTGIVVHPGDNLTVPKIILRIGAVTDSVTVTAEVAGVTTSTGEHSTLITSAQIQRLSTVGRDAAELVSILPGFTYLATDGSNGAPNYQTVGPGYGNLGNFGSNGAAPQTGMVNINSDGANIIDAGDMGGNIANINMDQVQEVKVQTSNFGADQARGPVLIDAVGKSGGSEYHGSLYTYLRNSGANANDWLSKYFGAARPESRYFYPGGGISGPVKIPGTRFNHDKKLLFYVGYEYYGQQQVQSLLKAFIPPSTVVSGEPTSMLGGDLSATAIAAALNIPGGASALSAGCSNASTQTPTFQSIGGVCVSAAGSTDSNGNKVPASGVIPTIAIDKGFAAYSQWFPKPNRVPQPVLNASGATESVSDEINYAKNQMQTINGFQLHSRVDLNISDTLKLYVTYNLEGANTISHTGSAYGAGSNIPMPTAFDANTPVNTATLNVTKTLGSSMTNEMVLTGTYFTYPGQYEDPKLLSTESGGGNQAWGSAGTGSSPWSYDGGITNWTMSGANVVNGAITNPGTHIGEHQVPTMGSWDGPLPSFGWNYVPSTGQFQHKFAVNASDNFTKVYKTHSIKAGFYAEQTGNNGANLGSNLAGNSMFMRWDGCYVNEPLSNFPAGDVPSGSGTKPASMGAGNIVGNMLMGCPGYTTQDMKDISSDLRYTTIEGYVTDEWKVLSKLTVTLGIRLSHIGPWTDQHGVGSAVWEPSKLTPHQLLTTIKPEDPTTWLGFTWHAIDHSVPVAGVPTRLLFFAPRFSLAYDLRGNGKTVFRGGWGAYHSHDSLFYAVGAQTPLGAYSWNSSSGVNTACSFAQLYSTSVIPCGHYTRSSVSSQAAPFNVSAQDPHDDREPVTYNYNFTVDQSLPWKMQAELAYVGNQSSSLSTQSNLMNQNVVPLGAFYAPDPVTHQLNPADSIPNTSDYRPYPNYTQITVPSHQAWANYNAMQASLNKQAGSLIFGANYTWSKALAVGGNWDSGAIADPIDMHHDYGIAPYNRRHVINGTYSWQEGSKFHGNRIMDGFVNGWEVSGIVGLQSGPDLSVLNSYESNYNFSGSATYYPNPLEPTTATSVRVDNNLWLGTSDYALQPTVTCNPAAWLSKANHQYVNGACFGLPAQGTEGAWHLPYIQGPKFFKWDMSVYKDFKISDRQNMQFRLAGFNFLNHPLISFSGQDPSNPLSLVIGDCPPNQNPCPVYTTLQQALNGMVVMNGGGYSFGNQIQVWQWHQPRS